MLNKLQNNLKKILKTQFFRSGNIISYIEAKELLKDNASGILLDVRSKQEYNEYHLNGAICIPTYELQEKVQTIIEDKNSLIIVYCQSGGRSKKAVSMLKKMGYTNLYEIYGGLNSI